jgi:hypothetical protein
MLSPGMAVSCCSEGQRLTTGYSPAATVPEFKFWARNRNLFLITDCPRLQGIEQTASSNAVGLSADKKMGVMELITNQSNELILSKLQKY